MSRVKPPQPPNWCSCPRCLCMNWMTHNVPLCFSAAITKFAFSLSSQLPQSSKDQLQSQNVPFSPTLTYLPLPRIFCLRLFALFFLFVLPLTPCYQLFFSHHIVAPIWCTASASTAPHGSWCMWKATVDLRHYQLAVKNWAPLPSRHLSRHSCLTAVLPVVKCCLSCFLSTSWKCCWGRIIATGKSSAA